MGCCMCNVYPTYLRPTCNLCVLWLLALRLSLSPGLLSGLLLLSAIPFRVMHT